MKKLIAAALATTALTAPVAAEEITEFRIGILGGENAQDRLNNNECLREYTEKELGVETKLFAPADYNGVIQGLLGGTIDMSYWAGCTIRRSSTTRRTRSTSAADAVQVRISAPRRAESAEAR